MAEEKDVRERKTPLVSDEWKSKNKVFKKKFGVIFTIERPRVTRTESIWNSFFNKTSFTQWYKTERDREQAIKNFLEKTVWHFHIKDYKETKTVEKIER